MLKPEENWTKARQAEVKHPRTRPAFSLSIHQQRPSVKGLTKLEVPRRAPSFLLTLPPPGPVRLRGKFLALKRYLSPNYATRARAGVGRVWQQRPHLPALRRRSEELLIVKTMLRWVGSRRSRLARWIIHLCRRNVTKSYSVTKVFKGFTPGKFCCTTLRVLLWPT